MLFCQYANITNMIKNDFLIKFGRNICAERNRLGLTQEYLAEKVGINVRNLGRIERGESDPKFSNVIAIMKALNVPFEALYKE